MKEFMFDGSFGDLSQFGIHCLTGESCAYGVRLLCDLTKTGQKVIMATLGIPPANYAHGGIHVDQLAALPFHENWNSGSARDPHVASIHLGRDMIQTIAIIGMFEVYGCDSVLVFDGYLIGLKLEDGEEFSAIQLFVGLHAGRYRYDEATGNVITVKEPVDGYQRSITPTNHPRRGGFAVHQMTGRSL